MEKWEEIFLLILIWSVGLFAIFIFGKMAFISYKNIKENR